MTCANNCSKSFWNQPNFYHERRSRSRAAGADAEAHLGAEAGRYRSDHVRQGLGSLYFRSVKAMQYFLASSLSIQILILLVYFYYSLLGPAIKNTFVFSFDITV